MAGDALTNLVTNLGVDFAHPITLAMNLILSTLIGGIVLLVIVEIFGKKFKEKIHPVNAFLVVLIINIINLLGVVALISPYVSFIPMITWVLPILIWVILIKMFFKEMKFSHAIITGIIGFALSIFLVPMLIGMASGFMPTFE
jgi:hypothetical protein